MGLDFTSNELASLCNADGEFRLAARFWTGGLRLHLGDRMVGVVVTSGQVSNGDPGDRPGVISLTAPHDIWAMLLAARPPRLCNDIANLIGGGAMALEADPVLFAQYYPATMRAVELLRAPAEAGVMPMPAPPQAGRIDAPVGRYVHLNLEGQDYRVYFEEAGTGIPLLLQHTAGCHGAQWRHLFECAAITDKFRLIAYDLPFHGKSLPPTGPKWWESAYRLSAPFLRSVPLALSAALGLDRPVFMGCSVGGALALDLARHYPDAFRAVISLEGALKLNEDISALDTLWHPQVSNEYKARLMNALMSPTSPVAFRKETSQVYAAGWPPVFLGDLHYYLSDFDLREEAGRIDTAKVGVHILSGEYDVSGTAELGRAAHEAIAGSTWTFMSDVGHFPMSENPDVFIGHLRPVLDFIARGAAS